jgi:DNA polymerase III epsilon subunit-like protein
MLASLIAFLEGERRLLALGHNIGFDVGFLKALFTREGKADKYGELFSYHSVDTIGMAISMDLAKLGAVNGYYGLGKLCTRFEIPLLEAHSASADVAATVNLYRHLVKAVRGDVVLTKPTPKPKEALLVKIANTWRLSRGKHKDKTLKHIANEDPSYLSWMLNKVDDLTDEMKEAVREHSGS